MLLKTNIQTITSSLSFLDKLIRFFMSSKSLNYTVSYEIEIGSSLD